MRKQWKSRQPEAALRNCAFSGKSGESVPAVVIKKPGVAPASRATSLLDWKAGWTYYLAMNISRILLVDDMASSLETMALFLEIEGYEVRTAKDGQEGVDAALEFQPDLILMDLNMPVKDGYEAAREIRANKDVKQPVLVALSGWELDKVKDRIDESGFDQALCKPVSPDDIRALLKGSPGSGGTSL